MENLLNEILSRRAYRAFDERKISDDIIHRIMTAATYAPSCSNIQALNFFTRP